MIIILMAIIIMISAVASKRANKTINFTNKKQTEVTFALIIGSNRVDFAELAVSYLVFLLASIKEAINISC